MNRMQILLAAVLALSFSMPTSAQESEAYAQMARATWSAFECSSLASKAGKPEEQQRLFLYGYEQGKQFIAALQAGKVDQKDLSSEAPLIVLLLLQGPSPDFMLGRIFESSQKSVLRDVFTVGRHYNSDEEQKVTADNKFWKLSCQLIGSGR